MNRKPRSQSRLALLVSALLAALVAFAAPAFAHDQLVSSTPAADEVLTEAPAEITLEYSSELLDLGESSTIIMVVDANEKDWLAGTPTLDRNVVTAPLAPDMPAGSYEIRWQVVSSDGHPITGIVPFSIAAAEPTPVAETQEPEISPTPAPVADTAAPVEAETSEGMPQPLRIILLTAGGAAIAFALFYLSLRVVRRKRD